MPRIEVDLPTPDGPCHATLHVPADGLPVPAAILFPDAAGPRETFRAVADRLAATGYAVLLPDVYHRLGRLAAVRRRDGVLRPAGAGAVDDDGAQRDGGDDHPGRRGVPRVPRGPPRGGRPAGRRVRLLHGRAGRAARRRPVPGPGRGGRVVPRGPAGRRRRPGQPASPRRPGAGRGVRRRRRERRDLPARAVRAPGGRVHRGGRAAHDGGLSRGARVRGAGQRDVRRGGGRAAPCGASRRSSAPICGAPR